MRTAPTSRRPARPGFTLIELLTVMAIIAILIGLTAAAVFRFKGKGQEVQTRNDISQLATAIQAFQVKYMVNYIPSRIILRNNLAYNMANPDERDSANYLKKVWPQLSGVMNWFPDDLTANATTAYYLEGDQCLVFFLGGIQSGKSCVGFSTIRANPTNLTGQLDAPLFKFPSARLDYATIDIPGQRTNKALSFFDPFGAPYAYFSSWGGVGYNYLPTVYPAVYGALGDCDGLQNGIQGGQLFNYGRVLPYKEGVSPQVRYYNRDGFQIISAGRDNVFGPGDTAWNAASGYDATPYRQGVDDLSNFHDKIMGAGL